MLVACTEPTEHATRNPAIEASVQDAALDAIEEREDDEEEIDAGPETVVLPKDAPCIKYASMKQSACEAELRSRKIAFVRGEPLPDVLAPIRLRGPLHGVEISSGSKARTPMDVIDCRLVLALDDFTAILAKHDVKRVLGAAYRSKANHGCTPKYAGKQHCGALAIDVPAFEKKDGTKLEVERDFHGRVGSWTCRGAHPDPPSAVADELWSFVCEAEKAHLFHVILTPNTNVDHRDHMHFEVTPNANWMLVH